MRQRVRGAQAIRRASAHQPIVMPRPPAAAASEQTLDQQQPRETPAAGAERGPQREVGAPGGVAGEQQVGGVGAGDDQQQPDGCQQQEQRTASTSRVSASRSGSTVTVQPVLNAGSAPASPAREPGHLGARGVERHTGRETGDDAERSRTAAAARGLQAHHGPEVDVAIAESERGGHHAPDHERARVQGDGAADNVRRGAEPGAPEPMADEDDVGASASTWEGPRSTPSWKARPGRCRAAASRRAPRRSSR